MGGSSIYNRGVFNLLRIADVLSPVECASIVKALRGAASAPATVSGSSGPFEPRTRKTLRLSVPQEIVALILGRLTLQHDTLEAHFGLALGACEEPQFLLYRAGDFFVAHQDGNTPTVHDDTRFRRLSVVIFLNSDYQGGSFVMHGRWPQHELRQEVAAVSGTLIAFPAETTHEVLPVHDGERFTIVTWLGSATSS